MRFAGNNLILQALTLLVITGGCLGQVPVLGAVPPYIYVNEDLTNGSVLFNFTATHSSPNEEIFIRINSPETAEIVYINQTSGNDIQVQIITKTILDRDGNGLPGKQTVDLKFKAVDKVFSEISFQTSLYIGDINDNKPVLDGQPYSWEIKELPYFGNETFKKISAHDIDSDMYGTQGIRFRMEPITQSAITADDYRATFDMDPVTGEVSLTKQLDYTTYNYYQFSVTASDNIGTGNTGYPGDFIIRVLDVQNKPPFFIGVPYRESIKENSELNHFVLRVSARDGDTGVPNPVNFTILPGLCSTLFNIDGDGNINTAKEIDRDAGDVFDASSVCILQILMLC